MCKNLIHILCAMSVVLLSSCASMEMIARAQGKPGPKDPPDHPPLPPQPLYYALVPVVFPFDAIAWPIEYFVMRNTNTDDQTFLTEDPTTTDASQ